MLRHGSNTRARSLRIAVIFLPLSAIALIIFIILRKMNLSSNKVTFYGLLLAYGMSEPLARFMTAQAAHETAGFTSGLLRSNNNAFGMKYAGQKYAQGEKNGYADYKSVDYSILDLIDWYTRHRNNIFSLPLYISTLADYVSFLKRNNYFEASEAEYLNGATYFYNELFA